MPGWVRGVTRVAAELGEEAEPWSVVVFEGLGWLRGMVGAVGPSAFCAVMTGLELAENMGEESGVVLWEGK